MWKWTYEKVETFVALKMINFSYLETLVEVIVWNRDGPRAWNIPDCQLNSWEILSLQVLRNNHVRREAQNDCEWCRNWQSVYASRRKRSDNGTIHFCFEVKSRRAWSQQGWWRGQIKASWARINIKRHRWALMKIRGVVIAVGAVMALLRIRDPSYGVHWNVRAVVDTAKKRPRPHRAEKEVHHIVWRDVL